MTPSPTPIRPATKRPSRFVSRSFAGLLLLLLLAAVACVRQPAGSGAPVIPTAAPSPPAALRATGTSRPPPAPTVTSQALPTSVPEPANSPTAEPVCAFDYFFEPAPETCAAAMPVASAAAEQPFEGGLMIWLEENGSIIVFYDDGRWQRFADTWSEDQPASDPAIAPPIERFQPVRGFGKIWRERPEVRETLGWALGVELGFQSTLQEQATIPGLPDQSYIETYNGQIFALIHRAPDQGDWVLAADNR